MIDRYLSGRVDRISPEAPVPVMLLGEEDNRLGGAANVALNLKALSATPLLAGVVGEDENGHVFRQLLSDNDLDESLVVTDSTRCTTVKTRLVAQGQQLIRVDREETHDLKGAAAGAVEDRIRAVLAKEQVDLLLFQDYNKGVLTPDLIQRLIALATEHGVLTAVDPKKANFWAFRKVSLFKPNLREIQQQCDFSIAPELASLDRAAKHIFNQLACAKVMITLSEHGIYVNDGATSAIYPTQAKKVRDVSGAGDTVISVAACGL
ncbi:MAG: bifunctional ADP-heptose synthase, partial [Bacteroidota bacterium]